MESFQAQFHRRWGHLNDSHVRALAWLVDAPDLLDAAASQWHGKIATLDAESRLHVQEWLAELDRSPRELHDYVDVQAFSRLGRYAEKLMAFYFRHRGVLVAHGLQVRAEKHDTVGEFDFLLRAGQTLVHWEFATKFYLLESTGAGHEADYFVGPNLADTLFAKMRKILDRQLSLAGHPAAQGLLPQPIASAQALVKGWLFYHDNDPAPAAMTGISELHCKGFWCTLAELDALSGEDFAILPRLRWLPPAKLGPDEILSRQSLRATLHSYFEQDSMPVMVAVATRRGDHALEMNRGFIVPNDWRVRAAQRMRGDIPAGDAPGDRF